MKVGDCISRCQWMDEDHQCGIIIEFDKDGDPIILWNNGEIEEEYGNQVKVHE